MISFFDGDDDPTWSDNGIPERVQANLRLVTSEWTTFPDAELVENSDLVASDSRNAMEDSDSDSDDEFGSDSPASPIDVVANGEAVDSSDNSSDRVEDRQSESSDVSSAPDSG